MIADIDLTEIVSHTAARGWLGNKRNAPSCVPNAHSLTHGLSERMQQLPDWSAHFLPNSACTVNNARWKKRHLKPRKRPVLRCWPFGRLTQLKPHLNCLTSSGAVWNQHFDKIAWANEKIHHTCQKCRFLNVQWCLTILTVYLHFFWAITLHCFFCVLKYEQTTRI